MPRELETSEVVLYLLATVSVLALIGAMILHFEEHRNAEIESHYMGCKYMGKVTKNIYAFECGQNIVLKHL